MPCGFQVVPTSINLLLSNVCGTKDLAWPSLWLFVCLVEGFRTFKDFCTSTNTGLALEQRYERKKTQSAHSCVAWNQNCQQLKSWKWLNLDPLFWKRLNFFSADWSNSVLQFSLWQQWRFACLQLSIYTGYFMFSVGSWAAKAKVALQFEPPSYPLLIWIFEQRRDCASCGCSPSGIVPGTGQGCSDQQRYGAPGRKQRKGWEACLKTGIDLLSHLRV